MQSEGSHQLVDLLDRRQILHGLLLIHLFLVYALLLLKDFVKNVLAISWQVSNDL